MRVQIIIGTSLKIDWMGLLKADVFEKVRKWKTWKWEKQWKENGREKTETKKKLRKIEEEDIYEINLRVYMRANIITLEAS